MYFKLKKNISPSDKYFIELAIIVRDIQGIFKTLVLTSFAAVLLVD